MSCNVEDYKIGFGSFVDKEVSPYISLLSPDNCQQVTKNCPPPYRSVVGHVLMLSLINQMEIFPSHLISLIVTWF